MYVLCYYVQLQRRAEEGGGEGGGLRMTLNLRVCVCVLSKCTLKWPKIKTRRIQGLSIKGPKIVVYYSKKRSLTDFQSLLGAHQMWSIC